MLRADTKKNNEEIEGKTQNQAKDKSGEETKVKVDNEDQHANQSDADEAKGYEGIPSDEEHRDDNSAVDISLITITERFRPTKKYDMSIPAEAEGLTKEIYNAALFDVGVEDANPTPLHFAAFRGDALEVEALIANKAEVNAKTHLGKTALHAAVEGAGSTSTEHKEVQNFVGVVKALLNNKADVNSQTKKRNTALIMATLKKNEPMKQTLLTAGADPELANMFGMIPNLSADELMNVPSSSRAAASVSSPVSSSASSSVTASASSAASSPAAAVNEEKEVPAPAPASPRMGR